MSLKTVKVQIGFELYHFWGFYFLSKTLLKFWLWHISKTNWHKQKQNSNSCLDFDGSISSLANYVWTEVIFFFMSASNPFWIFFLSSNLEFVLRTFFFKQIHFGLYFLISNLEGFWEQVDERAFWILFLIPSRFWIYFRVQTGFGFSFCVQIPFGLNDLSSNTFCIFLGAQVQIHFGFCLWVQFHLGFFQSWKINFGISVLKF